MKKFLVLIQNRVGLKPDFSTQVNVVAYDENHAKQKAIGKVIEHNPIFKRRRDQKYWSFQTINLTKGSENGSEEKSYD